VLNIANEEHRAINADHREMCRWADANDPTYISVLRRLDWYIYKQPLVKASREQQIHAKIITRELSEMINETHTKTRSVMAPRITDLACSGWISGFRPKLTKEAEDVLNTNHTKLQEISRRFQETLSSNEELSQKLEASKREHGEMVKRLTARIEQLQAEKTGLLSALKDVSSNAEETLTSSTKQDQIRDLKRKFEELCVQFESAEKDRGVESACVRQLAESQANCEETLRLVREEKKNADEGATAMEVALGGWCWMLACWLGSMASRWARQ
jgi:methyl-accepting chemotaxis protein